MEEKKEAEKPPVVAETDKPAIIEAEFGEEPKTLGRCTATRPVPNSRLLHWCTQTTGHIGPHISGVTGLSFEDRERCPTCHREF